jgi:hypothetical protein
MKTGRRVLLAAPSELIRDVDPALADCLELSVTGDVARSRQPAARGIQKDLKRRLFLATDPLVRWWQASSDSGALIA